MAEPRPVPPVLRDLLASRVAVEPIEPDEEEKAKNRRPVPPALRELLASRVQSAPALQAPVSPQTAPSRPAAASGGAAPPTGLSSPSPAAPPPPVVPPSGAGAPPVPQAGGAGSAGSRPNPIGQVVQGATRAAQQYGQDALNAAMRGMGNVAGLGADAGLMAKEQLPVLPGLAGGPQRSLEAMRPYLETARQGAPQAFPSRLQGETFGARMEEAPVTAVTEAVLENAPTSGASMLVGLGASLVATPAAGTAAGAATGGAIEAISAYGDARRNGATKKQALTAAGITGVVNAILEAIPVGKLVKGVDLPVNGVKDALKKVLGTAVTSAGIEGVQEASNIGSAYLAYLRSQGAKLKDLVGPALDAALQGSVVGFFTGGGAEAVSAGSLVGEKPGRKARPPEAAAPPPRDTASTEPTPQAPADARTEIPIPTTTAPWMEQEEGAPPVVAKPLEAMEHAGSGASPEAEARMRGGTEFFEVSPGGDVTPIIGQDAVDRPVRHGYTKFRRSPNGELVVESGKGTLDQRTAVEVYLARRRRAKAAAPVSEPVATLEVEETDRDEEFLAELGVSRPTEVAAAPAETEPDVDDDDFGASIGATWNKASPVVTPESVETEPDVDDDDFGASIGATWNKPKPAAAAVEPAQDIPGLRSRYDEVQRAIDRVEDGLLERGENISRMFNPLTTNQYEREALEYSGPGASPWRPMPDELAQLYAERDRIQRAEDAVFVEEAERTITDLEPDPALRKKMARELTGVDRLTRLPEEGHTAVIQTAKAVVRHLLDSREWPGLRGHRRPVYNIAGEIAGTPENPSMRLRMELPEGSAFAPPQEVLVEAQRWMDRLHPGAKIPGIVSKKTRPAIQALPPKTEQLPPQVRDVGVGQEGAVRIGQAPQQEDTVLDQFDDQELAADIREATVGQREPGVLDRAANWIQEKALEFGRERKFLPHGERFAPAREAFRYMDGRAQVVGERLAGMLQQVTGPLKDAQYQNLVTKLAWDHFKLLTEKKGPEFKLPFGLTAERLATEGPKVDAAVANDPHVQRAIAAHRDLYRYARERLRSAYDALGRGTEFLDAEGDLYLHHQVMEMMETARKPGGRIRPPGGAPFERRRKGSERPINMNYEQAQGSAIFGMLIEAERAETFRKMFGKYDILPELRKEAAERRRAGREMDDPAEAELKALDLVPDGYTVVSSDNPTYFPADSLLTSMAEAIRQDGMGTVEKKHLRQLMAVGKRKQWVLPVELAAQLQEDAKQRHAAAIHRPGILERGTQATKRALIHSPRAFPRYIMRNLFGDTSTTLSFNPDTAKHYKRAVADILTYMRGEQPSAEFDRWFNLGGWNGTIFSQEVDRSVKLRQRRALEDFMQLGDEITSSPKELVRWWFRHTGKWAGGLESINRYATFLSYRKQLEKTGTPKNWGASIPAEISALSSLDEKAYWLSNELVGAYDMVSVAGQKLRKTAIPFFSFAELNARRYSRLLRNEKSALEHLPPGIKLRLRRHLGKTPFVVSQAIKFTARAMMVEAALFAWNRMFREDDEKKLPEDVRRRPHITYGSDGENVYYFDRLGNFAELREWLGVDEFVFGLIDYYQGKKSIPDVVRDMLDQPASKLVGSLSPIGPKGAFELLSGKSFFPSVLNQREIKDRIEYVARIFTVDEEMRAISRALNRAFGNVVARPDREGSYFRTFGQLVWYEHKIGQPQYNDVLSVAMKMRNEGMDIKLRSLRAARHAMALGDRESAIANLYIYQQNGGTADGLRTSLRNLHPLAELSDKEKAELRQRFGDDTVDRAVKYYETAVAPSEEIQGIWEAARAKEAQ